MKTLRIAYLVTLALLLFSTLPVKLAAEVPLIQAHWQPLTAGLHAAAFFGLGCLMLTLPGRLPRWLILVGLSAFAGGSEMAQALVPRRVADPADLAMNLAGIALAALLVRLFSRPVEHPATAGRIAPAAARSHRKAA